MERLIGFLPDEPVFYFAKGSLEGRRATHGGAVALLGAVNAILFKKTGRLEPAIVLHAVYNAVVTIR